MESRTLDLTLISAKDLKNVNFFTKMDVYVVVYVAGEPYGTHQRTPVHKSAGKEPAWNYPLKFTIDAAAADQNRLTLVFKLRSARALGDRDIGHVSVPVKELLDAAGDGKSMKFMTYDVRKPSGKLKGVLNFSFKFGEKFTKQPPPKKAEEPLTAYPAYPTQAGSSSAYPPPQGYGAYPPPQAGYGYPSYAPPPQGPYAGYPAAAGGYGYAQAQRPARNNNGFGMGLGAGLLGGMLGGMVVGDMMGDAAAYDAGYDAGFDDGGDFF